MAFSGKRIKRILIILALIAVSAWFWGNAALQVYMYRFFARNASDVVALNEVPKILELDEQEIEGEDLYFYGFTARMPFLKKATSAKAYHVYLEGRLFYISLLLYKDDKFNASIYIHDHTPYSPTNAEKESEASLPDRLWNTIWHNPATYMEFMKLMHHAKLSDMSWWNLPGSWRLMSYLIMKSMGRHTFADGYYNVYDVETPHVKGYLVEAGNDRLISESFVFTLDNRSYTIDISLPKVFKLDNGSYTIDISLFNKPHGLRNLIGSIRPANDEERSYGEASALAGNNPGYPEELLLLSQISIKGPVEKHQKEYILKGLEEDLEHALNPSDGEKDEDYVERIRKEIAELKEAIEEGN